MTPEHAGFIARIESSAAVVRRAVEDAPPDRFSRVFAGFDRVAVAELLAVERPTRMRVIGLPDVFAAVGPTVPRRARYGMSAEAIAAACRDLLR